MRRATEVRLDSRGNVLRRRGTPLELDPAEGDKSLLQITRTLGGIVRRQRVRVLLSWLAVTSASVGYAVTAIPEYTSSGALQIGEGGGIVSTPLADLGFGNGQVQVSTEVEIIKRREFTIEVLRRLGLHIVDPEDPHLVTLDPAIIRGTQSPISDRLRRVRAAISTASIAATRFEPLPLHLEGLGDGKLSVTVGDGPAEPLAAGDTLQTADLALSFEHVPLDEHEAIALVVLPDGDLLQQFHDRISVRMLGKVPDPTNLVEISVTYSDRATAQAIVHTMLELYVQRNLEHQTKSASQAATFIEGQLAEVSETLQRTEQALLEFSRQAQTVQLDTQARVAIESAAGLETQRITNTLQARTIDSVLARLGRNGERKAADLTANFFDDPVLAQAVAELTSAESKYEQLKATLTDAHPTVEELRRALEFQRQQVVKLLKSARSNLHSQRAQIDRELAGFSEVMKAYPEKNIELARLTRDMTVSERLYTVLLEKLEEAEILKASTATDKRVVDPASLPQDKTSPRRARVVAYGALAGLALGLVAAAMAHYRRKRLDTIDAIRDLVSVPVYGTIPLIATDKTKLGSVQSMWREHGSDNSLFEAFWALATTVSLVPGEPSEGKIIVVTSAQPGEGKSTIAANLAEAVTRTGKRVLLADLDLRRPTQHRMWGCRRAPGYTDLLAAIDTHPIGSQAPDSETRLLPSGSRTPDTVAAVLAPGLEHILRRAVTQFDFVIIDSPPAFVAETPALARFADLLLVVTRPGHTERPNLRQAIEILGQLEVPTGLILNGVGREHLDGHYGHYSYYYARQYERDGEQERKPA